MTALSCALGSSCPSARSRPRGGELFLLNSQLPIPPPCSQGTRRPSLHLAGSQNSGRETLKHCSRDTRRPSLYLAGSQIPA
jgi:hypothetical protein